MGCVTFVVCGCWFVSCFYFYGTHRYLHFLTHSFPTRRSSVLFALYAVRQKRRLNGCAPARGRYCWSSRRIAIAAIPCPIRPNTARAKRSRRFAKSQIRSKALNQPCWMRVFLRKNSNLSKRKSGRSEEHTSEIQSLMRISYAVFCLKKQIQ